jgi:hypothetical protein
VVEVYNWLPKQVMPSPLFLSCFSLQDVLSSPRIALAAEVRTFRVGLMYVMVVLLIVNFCPKAVFLSVSVNRNLFAPQS